MNTCRLCCARILLLCLIILVSHYLSIYRVFRPFNDVSVSQQFSQREKQRKLQELTVADRIVLNTTMAIVSNQTGRK